MEKLFADRIEVALAAHCAMPDLEKTVMAEVDAFFQSHPNVKRTEYAASIVAALITEHYQNEAGEPVATPKAA